MTSLKKPCLFPMISAVYRQYFKPVKHQKNNVIISTIYDFDWFGAYPVGFLAKIN